MEKRRLVALVGGYSPHLFSLPNAQDVGCPVIGINLWGRDYPCDYWVALDTFQYPKWRPWLDKLEAFKYLREPKSDEELAVDYANDIVFVDKQWNWREDELITTWQGQLVQQSTTALTAVHLAIILGFERVILWGVDFVGGGRADGSSYPKEDFWAPHVDIANEFLAKASKHIEIRKVHPESPLDVEYIDPCSLL